MADDMRAAARARLEQDPELAAAADAAWKGLIANFVHHDQVTAARAAFNGAIAAGQGVDQATAAAKAASRG